VIDDVFVVSDIKIIEGRNGRFLSMPSVRRKNGTFRDIAHPLNADTRADIEARVFARYDEVMAEDAAFEHGAGPRRRRDVHDDLGDGLAPDLPRSASA